MAGFVLYSCGGEGYSIWSSLASQAFLQKLLGALSVTLFPALPLKIKKCPGIVLDNIAETVKY